MSEAPQPEDQNRESIEQRQLERLRCLLREVAATNPFWQNRLSTAGVDPGHVESLSHVALLPLTQKSDLVEDQQSHPPYGTNLTYGRNACSRLHQTSGTTTGKPLRWLDTRQSWQWFMDCWAQIFRMVGLTEDDRLAFPFSFGPFIGFWAAFEGANRLGNLCLAGGGMTSLQRLRLIEDNEATVICGTPTYLLRLAEIAAEQGIDLAAGSVRMLVVAGEPGGSIPAIRSRIEQAWGARMFDHWGMTEIGALATECVENPGGMHVLETECIAEVIDPASGEPATADESGSRSGELVLTNLGRIGSPLIRYRTGDLVETDPNPCPCGRHLLRLRGGILGRADDMITMRGNNVFPSSVEAVLREFDTIAEFRIEVSTVRSMQHMVIQIEPVAGLDDVGRQVLAADSAALVRDRLNFNPEIQLVAENSLPRFELKGRRFFRVD